MGQVGFLGNQKSRDSDPSSDPVRKDGLDAAALAASCLGEEGGVSGGRPLHLVGRGDSAKLETQGPPGSLSFPPSTVCTPSLQDKPRIWLPTPLASQYHQLR